MKKFIVYILALVFATGCVSKKKYASLNARHDQTLNEKTGLEEVLNKVAVENDSLKQRNFMLDSMYRAEHEKNMALGAKSNSSPGGGTANYRAKVSGISKSAEYDKKALYIYNLPNYIFWPPNAKAGKFLIGIYGESSLNAALASTVYGKKINGLPAVVEPYLPAPDKVYQMIFVSESRQKDFLKLKKELKDQPVLLITENPYLEKVGAHISFYVDRDKVKFNVSKKNIEKLGMHVSEQLIKLSEGN